MPWDVLSAATGVPSGRMKDTLRGCFCTSTVMFDVDNRMQSVLASHATAGAGHPGSTTANDGGSLRFSSLGGSMRTRITLCESAWMSTRAHEVVSTAPFELQLILEHEPRESRLRCNTTNLHEYKSTAGRRPPLGFDAGHTRQTMAQFEMAPRNPAIQVFSAL